ncbi:MAG: ABC transporter ATP-binding protein/permease [Firmicutes bacterium]|nr:ABC transporter ATP-binding protein/permease [Bacillota bacterium]
MKKSTLKKLLRYIKPHSILAMLAIIFALIHVAALILAPVFIGSTIDYIIGPSNVNLTRVLNYCIYLLLAIITATFSSYLSSNFAARLSQKVIFALRIDAVKAINLSPISKIDTLSKGELAIRLTSDTERIAEGLTNTITQIFTFLALIIGTLVFMFRLNVTMALVVALLTPISVLIAALIAFFSHKLLLKQTAKEGTLASLTEEYIYSIKSIKLYNYQKIAQEKFDEQNRKIKDFGSKAVFISALTNPTTRFINGLVFACVTMVGAYLVLSEAYFSIGALSIFLAYAMQYARPFNEITNAMTEIQNSIVSAKRVFEIIDNDNAELKMHNTKLPCNKLIGKIQFKNVDFKFTDKLVINNFCLNIKQGQRIAIIGKSGSGKTTLINLLTKFFTPNSGHILIDDTNIDNIDTAILRQNIGLILQEGWIFKGTILDNIAFAKKDANKTEIIEASKKAHIYDFIVSLKDGFNTIIDHNTLSKGQVQLLCLARFFLNTPPIIILDEATSSIDARTDFLIQDALKNITKGHTSIIVAHRLETIKDADLIIELNEGKIIRQGTYAQLFNE